jgi:hypothetical protein
VGKLNRPGLPRQAVIDAALAAGLPVQGLEVSTPDTKKPWCVRVLSDWGWQESVPVKLAMGRAIADRLQAMGLCCAFDYVWTAGFDFTFDLQEVRQAIPESTWQPDLFGRPASSVAQQRGLFGEGQS